MRTLTGSFFFHKSGHTGEIFDQKPPNFGSYVIIQLRP